jgi:hypothetical protein
MKHKTVCNSHLGQKLSTTSLPCSSKYCFRISLNGFIFFIMYILTEILFTKIIFFIFKTIFFYIVYLAPIEVNILWNEVEEIETYSPAERDLQQE